LQSSNAKVIDTEMAALLKEVFTEIVVKDAPNVPLRCSVSEDGRVIINWPQIRVGIKSTDDFVNRLIFDVIAPMMSSASKLGTQVFVQRLLQRRSATAPVSPPPAAAKPAVEYVLPVAKTVVIKIDGGEAHMQLPPTAAPLPTPPPGWKWELTIVKK
jgi:hypothetical protein